MPGAAVFPIGEQPLHDALIAAGVDAPAADHPHVVLERLDELLVAPALGDRALAGRAPDRAGRSTVTGLDQRPTRCRARPLAARWDLPLRAIASGPGALAALPAVLDRFVPLGELALVIDGTPMTYRAGSGDATTSIRHGLRQLLPAGHPHPHRHTGRRGRTAPCSTRPPWRRPGRGAGPRCCSPSARAPSPTWPSRSAASWTCRWSSSRPRRR